MGKIKELWIEAYDNLYEQAIEEGFLPEDADAYASSNAQDVAMDVMIEHAEYLVDMEK